jgi:ATP-binding cassette subfamily C protein LapB
MRELFRRALRRPVYLLELTLAALLMAILGLASSFFVMLVFNRYIPYGVDATLVTLVTGALIAGVFEIILRTSRRNLAEAIMALPNDALAGKVFATLARARAGVIERIPAARLGELLRSLSSVERGLSADNLLTFIDVPFALLIIGVIAIINPILCWIVVFFTLASAAVSALGRWKIADKVRQEAEAQAAMQGIAALAIQQPDTVRVFNTGAFISKKWREIRERSQGFRREIAESQMDVQSFIQWLTVVQGIVIVAAGAVLVVRGEIGFGALIGANMLAARALAPLSRLVYIGESLVQAEVSMNRLRDFIRLPQELVNGSALKNYKGRVEFSDLAFAYPKSPAPLFEHLSLSLEPGDVLVVTGPNGAGKSTLARLLAGLIEPSRGQILVDGLDLRQLVPEWWRRQIIYVPQEPALMDATVADNISVNQPDASSEVIQIAAQKAGLKSWLDTTEKGLGTFLGEGGRRLALGLRRRIALARGLITEGKLAIFDEPFEGLDADGRQSIATVIEGMKDSGTTVIIFTHHPKQIHGKLTILDLGVKPVPAIIRQPGKKKGGEHEQRPSA